MSIKITDLTDYQRKALWRCYEFLISLGETEEDIDSAEAQKQSVLSEEESSDSSCDNQTITESYQRKDKE